MDKTILLSSYRCDPYDVSEASIAFIWLKILLKKFNIVLLTTKKAECSITKYYRYKLPSNLKIISFTDKYPLKKNRIVRESIKLGYFFFNYRIKSYLDRHPDIINTSDLIFQKSPASFRYFTSLVKYKKPVYLGPLSGGLHIPDELRTFFKKEPVLYKLRTLDSFILKLPVYKNQFRQLEKVIISFDYMKDIIPTQYLVRSKVLLDSGINCSEYTPVNNNKSTTRILYIGRLTRYKGAELLIRALKDLKNKDFILDIIGDGEEKKNLKKLVREFNLCDKIKFHGFQPRETTHKFYQSASIFCLPSITESIGIVFFEAMASGLPIITINNGGPKYICPEQGSIKIPIAHESEVIKTLKESLEYLIENPKIRKKMGNYNLNYCLRNYDWPVLEKEILSFFIEEVTKQLNYNKWS